MSRPVLSTYRLQLSAAFRFGDAAAVVPYLARLGVTHLYLSPVLQAAPGSAHGYDVVDHGHVSADLGGAEELSALAQIAQDAGMGLVVDIVANHMDISRPSRGSWWWDVLAHGPASPYANHFDIDWRQGGAGDTRVLLPVLDDHYGRVLGAGRFTVGREGGAFVVSIDHDVDRTYPLSPSSLGPFLGAVLAGAPEGLGGFIADGLSDLGPARRADARHARRRWRDASMFVSLLAELLDQDGPSRQAVETGLAALSSDPAALHAVLEDQHYRLANWRAGNSGLRYRRFFDVTSLVGLRVEEPTVFADTHRAICELVAAGAVDGLRVDHPDGLANPAGYFDALVQTCPEGTWTVAEKVLAPAETLRRRWPVAGTTGYDFLWRTTALFVDPAGERCLSDLYRCYTGDSLAFSDHLTECRSLVATTLLRAELDRATELLRRECDHALDFRDFTEGDLRAALVDVLAVMSVYRTYVVPDGDAGGGQTAAEDFAVVREAVDRAISRGDADGRTELLRFLGDLLTLTARSATSGELACRFQQLSGAVAAKGVEDTALYRYGRLLALNEVGGDPAQFGLPTREYHAYLAHLCTEWPGGMLAASTHDTKRSEDVRARIGALSEVAEEWAAHVARWTTMLEAERRAFDPGPATVYFFFQTLIGTFPIDPDRLSASLQKSVREAKRETSWLMPDPGYEAGLDRFVRAALTNPPFLASVEAFVGRCEPVARAVSLGQTALRLAGPGVADTYQGAELWTDSLVDPDNRRPIDFRARERILAAVLAGPAGKDVWGTAEDRSGRAKLALLHAGLQLRRDRPRTFLAGGYTPLRVEGPGAEHAVAFLRGEDVAVVVSRFTVRLGRRGGWGETTVELPPGRWRDQVSGAVTHVGSADRARVGDLVRGEPVALLAAEPGRD